MACYLDSLNDKFDGVSIGSLQESVSGKEGMNEPSFQIPLLLISSRNTDVPE